MIESITALLFAHVLADFVLQTNWINRNKAHPGVLMLHAAIVWATAALALGQLDRIEVLALAAVHLAIDAIKIYGRFTRLSGYLTDQAAHLATIVAVAAWVPDLWATGSWATLPKLLPLMALASGLVIALRAGEFAVGLLMRPHGARIRNNGLKDGGRLIGWLERGLIFLFVLINLPLGVGFLVAAKSVLRFGTATKDQRTAEYVIIGTLASFGWALIVAFATITLLANLTPLEIMPVRP